MTDVDAALEANNRAIRAIGQELAVLCQMRNLIDDLPGNTRKFVELYDMLEDEIIDILDRDMAVDPIEYAIGELAKPDRVEALETLAFAMLRHRDDHGEWSRR